MSFLAPRNLLSSFPTLKSYSIKSLSHYRKIAIHAAQVTQWAQHPLTSKHLPSSDSNLVQIKVLATGLHQVVRARATSLHYSAKTLPHNSGVDGVGTTPSGQEVYSSTSATPFGSFTEIINVPKEDTAPPPEGVDTVQVAAAMSPMLSSWMTLRKRTENLPKVSQS